MANNSTFCGIILKNILNSDNVEIVHYIISIRQNNKKTT